MQIRIVSARNDADLVSPRACLFPVFSFDAEEDHRHIPAKLQALDPSDTDAAHSSAAQHML
jgi:hypothetical protein